MKKLFKNKKVIIPIISILVIVIIGGSIYAVNAYNLYVAEQKIEQSINSIKDVYKDFKKETDRNKKLNILKSLEKEYNTYTSSSNDECFENVSEKYDDIINQMKEFFKDDYNKSLEKFNLNNLNKIKDKDKIKKYKNNLNLLLKTIKNENGIVCNNDEIKIYENKIKKLIDSYNLRINEIKVAEKKAKEEAAAKAAAAKKAEEEAAKAAENTTNYSSNNSSSNNSYNSNNSNNNNNNSTQNSSNSSNNNSSSNSNNSNYEWWSWTNEDGYTTYADNEGNHWNDKGDTYNGDLDGWGVTYN